MPRFRHQTKRDVPGLNLASLPDLIFTVLFFFMLVTHMRVVDPKVRYQVPQGSQLAKDVRKKGLVYIFIGKPVDAHGNVLSDETRIQLNDRYVKVGDIAGAIARERSRMGEDERRQIVVSIRADRDTEMGLINDVKQQLRKAGALHINYSATNRNQIKQ